jgi:cell division protein FtsW (lipid II flippase)
MTFSLLSIAVFTFLTFIAPYRFTRLKTLLNPKVNTTSTSYHSNQIVYALASGGLWGRGFANSNQKYKYLPKISTDSILAIIAEETGFIGVSLIFYIYLLLIGHLFRIAKKLEDNFESLLVAGVAAWIAFQTLINIGAIANIIPLTGIPLPFISYGGSSLVSLFFALGLVYNIEKKHHNLIYLNNEAENHHHRNPSHPRPRINKTIKGR